MTRPLDNLNGTKELSGWPLWAVFLFLGAVFYLAEPLDVFFAYRHLQISDVNDVLRENIQAGEEGSLKRRLALLALAAYGVIGLRAAAGRRLRIRGLLGWTILAFLAWTVTSCAWSIDPMTTVRKLLVLAFLCLGALATARLLSLDQVIVFALVASAAALAAGLCAEIAFGTFQPMKGWYRYSGLTWPAFSAWCFTLLFFAALVLRRKEKLGKGLTFLAAAAAVAFIILAKSRGAAGAFVVGLAGYGFLVWSGYRKVMFASLGCLAVTGALLYAELTGGEASKTAGLAVMLGRQKQSVGDLSGRSDVWRKLMPYIAERPYTGYGYNTFWNRGHLRAMMQSDWAVPDAHNGYIDLALGVGIPGAAMFAAILLLGIGRSVAYYRATSDVAYVFACCVIVVMLVNIICLASQLAPSLVSFTTMIVLAKLGFVEPPPRKGGG